MDVNKRDAEADLDATITSPAAFVILLPILLLVLVDRELPVHMDVGGTPAHLPRHLSLVIAYWGSYIYFYSANH